ncbi:hypothetical protein [Mammaliicoccus lentus]|uniref:hypothetical protein n=1 Tax=Mammaliicoccus lentus TaxID=42858 RepID=UPI001072E055|nr:hypothetical protein [Mammaliicoccus lentus]MBF0750447.1 hypothetical protein [Mammaliicoccus lentus]TFU56493.1 hypothetical protein E4T93_13785 [Mammaliicoccus lentus]
MAKNKWATHRQVNYALALQKKINSPDYTKQELENMTKREMNVVIENLVQYIAEDDLYNECMSYGLPNQ